MLTLDLLGQLRTSLARWRAPILDHLRPGIAEAAIDARLAPLGLHPSPELRLWWGWHDGAVPGRWRPGVEEQIGPLYSYISCGEGAADYVDGRSQLRVGLSLPATGEVDEDAVHMWWPPSWFPFSIGPSRLCVDCSTEGHSGTGRIHMVTREEPYPKPIADSLGQLVTWWITALDLGAWKYLHDSGDRRWTQDVSRLPDALRENPAMT